MIVVTRIPPGEAVVRLRAAEEAVVWEENRPMPRDALLAAVPGARGLYCMLTDRIDEELLDTAPDLVAVSSMAVGVDNIDVTACTRRGIPVGHTPDVLTETTADTAFGLLIAAARRFREGIDHVRDGEWGDWDPALLVGAEVNGTTLGIVGMGRIGRAVARRARGFGMTILYHNRSRDPGTEAETGAEYRTFEDLLAESDHVVTLVPLTPETHHLIGEPELRRMKPTAVLVNAARGPVIDPEALHRALVEGEIAAAGLDVTEPEPLPGDHPLAALPNCVILPHLGSASLRTRIAMADLAADNLLAALAGRRMPAVVNPAVYG